LIYCGAARVYEKNYPPWEKAMVGRLKEYLNTNPLTIDQTIYSERSDKIYNHLLINLQDKNYPIILTDENDQIFNGNKELKQTDIVIIHPATEYTKNRPDLLIAEQSEH